YNTGFDPYNIPGVHLGDGLVRISCLSPAVDETAQDFVWLGLGKTAEPTHPPSLVTAEKKHGTGGSRWNYFPN
ncbi:MAG TPA: hypothetical protein VIM71_00845, partial [Lacunisphaera sp.]